MSRIIKTISLDKETDEIASKMGNFSKWVRHQLREHNQSISLIHTNKELFLKRGICNPTNNPRCSICYPHGVPDRENIILFNQGKITKETLQERTKNHYDRIIENPEPRIIHFKPLDPPISPIKDRKYIRRSLKWIWSFI